MKKLFCLLLTLCLLPLWGCGTEEAPYIPTGSN